MSFFEYGPAATSYVIDADNDIEGSGRKTAVIPSMRVDSVDVEEAIAIKVTAVDQRTF